MQRYVYFCTCIFNVHVAICLSLLVDVLEDLSLMASTQQWSVAYQMEACLIISNSLSCSTTLKE